MLRNSETVSAIMNEWRSMDFSGAAQQATFNHEISDHNVDLFQECKHILPTKYSFLQCKINVCMNCKNLYNAWHDNCPISAITIMIIAVIFCSCK